MQYRDTSLRPTEAPHRYRKLKIYLVLIIVLAVGGHVLWDKHLAANAAAAKQAKLAAAAEVQRKINTFSNQVTTLLSENSQETIGIATASSNTALQTFGSTASSDAASDGKLLTATDYLHHVEEGTASLNQTIDGQSAEYLLSIMIINSDDTAWADLNDYLTHADLSAYAAKIGFANYDPSNNTFPASDATRILQQLYTGKLLNNADRSLLLGYLKKANYRQYIVPAVPSGDTVYHKIGLDVDNVNDAAIITRGNKYLVIAIFTNGNGTYDWPDRATLMQTITRDALAAYL